MVYSEGIYQGITRLRIPLIDQLGDPELTCAKPQSMVLSDQLSFPQLSQLQPFATLGLLQDQESTSEELNLLYGIQLHWLRGEGGHKIRMGFGWRLFYFLIDISKTHHKFTKYVPTCCISWKRPGPIAPDAFFSCQLRLWGRVTRVGGKLE